MTQALLLGWAVVSLALYSHLGAFKSDYVDGSKWSQDAEAEHLDLWYPELK